MHIRILGLAIVAAVASPAAAVESVTITSAGIYNPGNVEATVAGTSKSEFAVPLTFTATTDRKGTFDFLGFCVDLPHLIYVGINSQLKETLNYHVAPLTSDGYGNPLSSGQVREITGLARLGFTIAKGSAADKPAELAAVQQAIWSVEYPKATFVASGPYAAAQAGYAAAFIKEAPRLSGAARVILANDGNSQGQITDVGGVPEPAVWAELLAGFGVVGVLSRRRRGMMATVAA